MSQPPITADLRRLIDHAEWLDPGSIADAEILGDGHILRERPIDIPALAAGLPIPRPVVIGRHARYLGSMWSPHLVIGRHARIDRGATIGATAHAMTEITTGFLSLDLGREAFGAPPDEGRADPPVTVIGCDAWIGAGAFVRGGVRVGHGALVRPKALVTRDVPAFAIVAGNPARVCGERFPDAIAQRLLTLRWWTLPPDCLADLPLADPSACIAILEAASAAAATRA